jgi:hypothetical protein
MECHTDVYALLCGNGTRTFVEILLKQNTLPFFDPLRSTRFLSSRGIGVFSIGPKAGSGGLAPCAAGLSGCQGSTSRDHAKAFWRPNSDDFRIHISYEPAGVYPEPSTIDPLFLRQVENAVSSLFEVEWI